MCTLATLNKFAILNIKEYTENNSESSNTFVWFISISLIAPVKCSKWNISPISYRAVQARQVYL